jgi:hypothetical protein
MFRTELTIAPQERQLARTARVLTVGSCFADSIGARLRLNKVNALVTPFGTVFQPLALAQLLRAAAGEEQDWQQHVVEARGRWQSYDFHSTIGAESPVELLQLIQQTVSRVGEFVRTADAVVLTLGTAWAYRLRETGELVSNLHKLPASLFEKELLTADEIVNGLAEVHALLRRLNPNIRIVLTVSPVRHIKDTLPLNAVSKSVLRVACHYLSELLPGVSYFPAYELLVDELRDYRFYASDMLHPSEVAEDYIWDKFARAYFDADFGRFRKEWAAVRQSLGHRPLHLGAPEHRTFLDQTAERLERLASQGVDVRQEQRDVQRQLVALPPPKPVQVPVVEFDDDEERIDIGEATATEAVDNAPATQPTQAPTGRPERRDGRRNDRSGRGNQDRRTGREAAIEAQPEIASPSAAPIEAAVGDSVSGAEASELSLANDASSTEEASPYPAKKKKRRSRGGAKRTARKNAARLAAGQADGLAQEELEEELALENPAPALEEVSEQPALTEPVLDIAEPEAATITAEEGSSEPTSLNRRRGAGPTPKKSKVITKSSQVKRGQRSSLYRTPAPEATDSVPEVVTASAPIISPPIIPVALSERPAVELAEPPQLQPEAATPAVAEPDLAATVLGLYSSKPQAAAVAVAKPKRGRPKAAAEATPSTEAAPAVVPTTETATTPTEAADGPTDAAAVAKPAKKPAARASKAAKPAAPKKATAKASKPAAAKKTTAKPAATRRGRPPGDATAPAADEPVA